MNRGRPKSKKTLEQYGDMLIDPEYWFRNQEVQPNGCVHWTAGMHRQGYGMCGVHRTTDDKKIMTTTHRMAMRIKLGRELQTHEHVIHQPGCSPACINPEHLMLGDQAKRVEVMRANGHVPQQPRGKYVRSQKKQNRKYTKTPEELIWIRTAPIKEIAEKYNLTRARAGSMKHAIRNGYAWLKDYETK